MARARLSLLFAVLAITACGSRTPLEIGDAQPKLQPNWLIKGKSLHAQHVAIDRTGAVYTLATTGPFGSPSLEDRSLTDADDVHLFKRNRDGSEAWTKAFHTDDPTWRRGVGVLTVAVDPETGASYAGGVDGTENGGALFIRLDETGATQWQKNLGKDAFVEVTAVGPTGEGIFVGTFDEIDFGDGPLASDPSTRSWFAVAYDAAGNRSWSTRLPLDGGFVEDMAVDADGVLVLAGEFEGVLRVGDATLRSRPAEFDRFVVALEPGGAVRWARAIDATNSGSGPDRATSIGVDGFGHVYVSATFLSNVTVGDTTLTSNARSIFVAELDADGTPMRATSLAPEIPTPIVTALSVGKSGDVMLSANVGGPTEDARRLFLARLNPDFSLDWSWTAAQDAPMDGRLFDSDGQLSSLDLKSFAIAGAFTDTFAIDGASVTDVTSGEGVRNLYIGEWFLER